MIDTDLVSVIIPVYGVQDLLDRCVQSVVSQSHAALEIILVDDGSPDESGRICDDWARRDSRVRVIHQDNAGLSAARNAGLDVATGPLVTFIDSDDWIHPQYVQELRHLLMGAPDIDVAACGHVKTDGANSVTRGFPADGGTISNVQALGELLGPHYVPMVVAWGKLYRAHLFEGVRFPVGRYHEDEFTTHVVLWKSRRVALCGEAMYYYWQRPDSIMASYSLARNRDARNALLARAEFLSAVGLNDQATLTYLKALWSWRREVGAISRVESRDGLDTYRLDLQDLVRASRRYRLTPLRRLQVELMGLAAPAVLRVKLGRVTRDLAHRTRTRGRLLLRAEERPPEES